MYFNMKRSISYLSTPLFGKFVCFLKQWESYKREVDDMNQEIIGAVNKQVANWTVLYEKMHHYHWYVKGHHFFGLHGKFEEFYNEANDHIDELGRKNSFDWW